MSFDSLSKKDQKRLLDIVKKEKQVKQKVKEINKETYKNMNLAFKEFLLADGKYSEDQVPVQDLKYKKKKIKRFQNISGTYVEKAMVTLHNDYQLAITRPPQQYGSDPSLFDVSPREPDGTLNTTIVDSSQINQDILSRQTVSDISDHLKKIAKLDLQDYVNAKKEEQS